MKFQTKWGEYAVGHYGYVFFSNGVATKVFRKHPDMPDGHILRTFNSEVAAYRIASEHAELCKVVPQFLGVVEVSGVSDMQGKDLSHLFHLDLAYQMRFVEGEFKKESIRDAKLVEVFKRNGINYVEDCSTLMENDQIICVIDFATERFEIEWKD